MRKWGACAWGLHVGCTGAHTLVAFGSAALLPPLFDQREHNALELCQRSGKDVGTNKNGPCTGPQFFPTSASSGTTPHKAKGMGWAGFQLREAGGRYSPG